MSKKLETAIKKAIHDPFYQVIPNVKSKFAKNYQGRQHNFFLNLIPKMEKISPLMTITRSFESSLGNAIQKCARNMATITYGAENVPTIINPQNISFDLDNPDIQEKLKKALGQARSRKNIEDLIQSSDRQVIVSNISDASATVAPFLTRNKATHEKMKSLLTEKINHPTIHFEPVDLGYYQPPKDKKGSPTLNLHEIKAGGNLDSKNADANARKLMTHYCHTNNPDTKVFFSTGYNYKGEGNEYKGSITSYLSSEMILPGSSFWKEILPNGITFHRFLELYEEVMVEMQLLEKIEEIVDTEIEKLKASI